MPDVSIDNPIINSPFEEPVRQFRDLDEGITDEIIPGRRCSTYRIAAAPPKQRGKQPALDPDMTAVLGRPISVDVNSRLCYFNNQYIDEIRCGPVSVL